MVYEIKDTTLNMTLFILISFHNVGSKSRSINFLVLELSSNIFNMDFYFFAVAM